MSKLFTTPKTTEVPLIIEELVNQNFIEMEQSGEGNIFIDKVNRTFWICSDENLATNIRFADSENEKIEQTNLKEIQLWEN